MHPYRRWFSLAWHGVRAHRRLWVLGFLASFFGATGELGLAARYTTMVASKPAELPFPFGFFGGVANFLDSNWLVYWQQDRLFAVGIAVVMAAGFLFFLWLAVSAYGGVYSAAGVLRSDSGGVPLRVHFRVGQHYFWPVLGAVVIIKAAVYAAIISANIVLFALAIMRFPADALLVVVLALTAVVVVFGVAGSVAAHLAVAGIILDNLSMLAALQRAVRIIRRHPLLVMEVAALLGGVVVAVAAGTIFVLSPVVLWSVYAFTYGNVGDLLLSGSIGAVLSLLLVVISTSMLVPYQIIVWSWLYRDTVAGESDLQSVAHRTWGDLRRHGFLPGPVAPPKV